MISLYKYKDILEFINISIIMSVPIIAIVLYITFKNSSFLLVSSFFIIELVLIIILSKNKYEYPIILSILTNLTIIKSKIINQMKSKVLHLKEKKDNLKSNKEKLLRYNKKLKLEYITQDKYKEEIDVINKKINKSIYISEIPIFTISNNLECSYNSAFEEFAGDLNYLNINKNIYEFIKSKFIDSSKIIEVINKDDYISLEIKDYNSRVYKFICTSNRFKNKKEKICILKDITESTLIQNQLIESEQRYKNLMDILNDGVIIHDMKNINYINSKAIELFDIESEKDNLLIENIELNVNEKYKYNLINDMRLVRESKRDKIKTKIETNEGKVIDFITTKIVLDEEELLISIAVDITSLENILNALEQSEKTYELLLHTLPEGIVMIDKNTKKHIYRNKSMIEILKYLGVEKLNDLINKYTERYDYGEFHKFNISSDENLDISLAIIDCKKEDTLLVVIRKLEKNTVEEMEEKLNEIKYKNKFKTEFLANLTYDIKKPISNIFAANDVLKINEDIYKSKNIGHYTKLVQQNCYRLMRLLNNIEEIDNISNGLYIINSKKCDIVKLTKDIVDKSRRYVTEKGLDIDFISNVNKRVVTIDKEKYEKIILNLLSNSIKFTNKSGCIKVIITSTKEDVRIKVLDTGLGIPKDKLDIIFNDFEQVDKTLTRGAEGFGVGLSLVKKLADIQYAKIDVKSDLGKGSEFELILKGDVVNNYSNNKISWGIDFIDNEKVDIEFSDIYLDSAY